MDRLAAMERFVRIAEAGSLSAAARREECSLASVVRGLAALEAHLGARLINRTTRRLALTDAGEEFLAHAREILRQVAEAETAAARGTSKARGLLTVSAPLLFGRLHVAPVLSALLAREPELATELVLSDRNIDLLEEGVDAAVRIGTLADSSLVAVEVGRVRRVICASRAYLRRHGTPREPTDLAQHECLQYVAARNAMWSFGAGMPAAGGRFACNTAEALLEAALRGQGVVSLLSYQVADALRAGKLVEVLAQYAPPPMPVSVVYPHARLLPAKVRAFREAMVARRRDFDFSLPAAGAPVRRNAAHKRK